MSIPSLPSRQITIELESEHARLSGFRWFWAMVVTGFDDRHHCLKCLKGKRVAQVHPKWEAGEAGRVALQVPEGALVYICGVSDSYDWSRNFHLALRPCEDTRAQGATYNGLAVQVRGAEALPIPAETAAGQYPARDHLFLTCRNFQFAAHYFPTKGL